jgi:formylglycine-generating enzyme required for sulfatase activity/serine/threonine protein kinase
MPSEQVSPSPNVANAVPETQTANHLTVSHPASPSSGGQPVLTLHAGARPLPDYELVRKLGAGGFGEVWQARGPGGIDVALKFIRLEARGSALEVRALEVMKTIRHPNLAGLSGVWRTDEWLILAMELCDHSLQDRLNEALQQNLPGIPLKELLNYVRGAAEGLDALHEAKVQHRDVKPANLLLLHKGVKVADFGLAKMMEQTAASHTGAMTMAYAAPEFFMGETTRHSDQYSLAATYFHLRTGQLLFQGSQHQVMYGHLSTTPDLSKLPKAERAVVARALAKEPEKRWPSCEAFADALQEACRSDPQSRTKPLEPDANAMPPVPASRGKDRWLWPLAASLLLLLPLGYFYGGQIIRIATNQGQIIVEVDDPKIEVLVKDNGLVIQDGVGRREITVAAGPHELDVTIKDAAGETRLPTKKFTLSRDGKEVLNIRQELALAKKPEEPAMALVPEIKKPDEKKPEEAPKPLPPQLNKIPEPEKKPNPPQPAALPPTVTVDLGGGVKMEFVFIPKGRFKMGSPPDENERFENETQHEVEITKPFYLAKYPVTQEQYAKLVGDNPSWFRKGGTGEARLTDVLYKDTSRFPVENVSWYEANTFCTEKLKPFSAQMPVVLRQQNYRFALPTEAQWEYACRAGTTTPFSFGSILNGKQANCNGNYPYGADEEGPYKGRTTKVGEYGVNPWGLCDMHGNVYQWCADYYGPYDESLTKADPLRAVKYFEERRILRGGSWLNGAKLCRTAVRSLAPDGRTFLVGFRVCFRLDSEPEPKKSDAQPQPNNANAPQPPAPIVRPRPTPAESSPPAQKAVIELEAPDGNLVSTDKVTITGDGTIAYLNANGKEQWRSTLKDEGPIHKAAFADQGAKAVVANGANLLYIACNKSLTCWDCKKGQMIWRQALKNEGNEKVTFSFDQDKVVVQIGSATSNYDMRTGQRLSTNKEK